MKISTLEEHALRCLSQLARRRGKLTIAAIAEGEGLSEENTAKVMGRLRARGFVGSIRGKDGGYVLSRPAGEISVADVIESVSGSLFELERCQGTSPRSNGCIHDEDCSLRPMWTKLELLVHQFLDSMTIADLIEDESASTRRVSAVLRALDTQHLVTIPLASSQQETG